MRDEEREYLKRRFPWGRQLATTVFVLALMFKAHNWISGLGFDIPDSIVWTMSVGGLLVVAHFLYALLTMVGTAAMRIYRSYLKDSARR